MNTKYISLGFRGSMVSALFLCGAVGCASRENAGLERARFHLHSSQQNQQLAQNAPTVLSEADAAFNRADQEWRKNRDQDETDHLVYLTEQTLEIAREETRRKLGQSMAQVSRDSARIAAGTLRAERNSANVRAEANGLVAHRYQVESEHRQDQISQLDARIAALTQAETSRGLEFTLSEGVLFESNRINLKSGSVRKLAPLTELLKRFPERRIAIEGHTDNRGTTQANETLSQQRAEAVQEMFEAQGIEANRMASIGMGEGYPLASNQSEAGRLQNRRVQVVLLY